MTPEEIVRDAKDMVTHYPGDRLRLTGAEVMALVDQLVAERDALAKQLEETKRAVRRALSVASGESRAERQRMGPKRARSI